MGYCFSEHVYACVASGTTVVLDLKRDRYIALPPPVSQYLLNFHSNTDPIIPDQSAFEPLLREGILTPTDGPGFCLPTIDVALPLKDCTSWVFPVSSPASVMAAAAGRAGSILRFKSRPFFKTIQSLRHKKRALLDRHSLSQSLPPSMASLAAFLDTRFVLSTQDKCLPWSIAMVDAFHQEGVSLSLVIGVRVDPFLAHAWVQYGDVVLSDDLDIVLPYTPILAV